ncbi:hypothetical protein [Streptomyces sp. ISL-94]|uniref:hypothetical protein n=1 Tax=Streptomyces sp. ISL-94 TaxID=2819190 RepID=UPI001BEAE1E9|nr:hypothetical protein [Streptomyces sp. ISL-94]
MSGAFTAPVVDADTDAEVPWMATSFVVGLSLHSAAGAHGPLPEDALRMLTAGLAEAPVSVHGAGVIHRDLRPANVLLALDGPHVIDHRRDGAHLHRIADRLGALHVAGTGAGAASHPVRAAGCGC